jgi:hypothetical protein
MLLVVFGVPDVHGNLRLRFCCGSLLRRSCVASLLLLARVAGPDVAGFPAVAIVSLLLLIFSVLGVSTASGVPANLSSRLLESIGVSIYLTVRY